MVHMQQELAGLLRFWKRLHLVLSFTKLSSVLANHGLLSGQAAPVAHAQPLEAPGGRDASAWPSNYRAQGKGNADVKGIWPE